MEADTTVPYIVDDDIDVPTYMEPVNTCVSSGESPNFVEPVTEMLITSRFSTLMLISFAFMVPETLSVPVTFSVEPSKVKFDSADMVPSPSAVRTLLTPSFAILIDEMPVRFDPSP